MRARNIKPGFFKNEILAECHPLSRILFSGLWCLADREGRLEDRPKRIKADVLPYDNISIEKHLDELASKRDADGKPAFILRYSVNGGNYIQILHFSGHQHPNVKEQSSTIPAPCEHSADTVPTPNEHGEKTPLYPIPYTENPILKPDRDKHGVFESFWNAYPRKVGKGKAEASWKKIREPTKVLNLILKALHWQKTSEEWTRENGKYIPHPATYLNQRRWEDEPGKGVQASGNPEKTCKTCGKGNRPLDFETGICFECDGSRAETPRKLKALVNKTFGDKDTAKDGLPYEAPD